MEHPLSFYEEMIASWVFSERDREIMREKILNGKTFEQVAELFGMTPRNVQYIVDKHSKEILRHIEEYDREHERMKQICVTYEYDPKLIGEYILKTIKKKDTG